jgi:hypothetical protein
MKTIELSRRSFIIGSGAGALGISFGAMDFANAQAAAFSPVAWVSIGADNTATIFSAASKWAKAP